MDDRRESDAKVIYFPAEAAALIGISIGRLCQLAHEGRIRAEMTPRGRRFRRDDVLRLIEDRRNWRPGPRSNGRGRPPKKAQADLGGQE